MAQSRTEISTLDPVWEQVVNEALLNGLAHSEQGLVKRYRQQSFALGSPMTGINLDKALLLADELEDEAIITKMEQRK